MAKKTKKVDEDKQVKAVQKAVNKQVKKGVKKAMKNKTFVAIVAVLLVIAIVSLAVIYFVRPDILEDIFGIDLNATNSNNKKPVTINEGDLAVYFLDIGQGDFIYITFPDGKDMVIDAGNQSKNLTNEKAAAAFAELDEYNQDDVIDYVMLTHGDEDHVSYIDNILDIYQVNTLYMPNIKPEESKIADANLSAEKLSLFTDPDVLKTAVYAEFFIAALNEPNCEIILNVGEFAIVGETYRFDFYCLGEEQWADNTLKDAEEKNAISPIGVLEYNGKRVVFTGDSNLENEPHFVNKIKKLDCDVLKAGHHGSDTSSMPSFLDAITCEYVVFSCGYDNNHKHPRQDTLDRFVERNYQGIYRTDLQGTITMVISGSEITFSTKKQASREDLIVGWDTLKAQAEAA